MAEGDPATARMHLEEALPVFREIEDVGCVARVLDRQGQLLLDEGRHADARTKFAESLLTLRGLEGRREVMVRSLASFARLAAATQLPVRAARLLSSSEALISSVHSSVVAQRRHWLDPHERRHREDLATSLREALGDEAFQAAWEEGQALSLDEAVELALKDDDEEEKE
jgi:hypothetical protein